MVSLKDKNEQKLTQSDSTQHKSNMAVSRFDL